MPELLEQVAGFYAAFETGDVASLDTVFHPDWTDRTPPPGRAPGLAGMKEAILALRGAVPDLAFTREKTVAGKEEIAVHGRFTGTHTAPFGAIPPSRNPSTSSSSTCIASRMAASRRAGTSRTTSPS